MYTCFSCDCPARLRGLFFIFLIQHNTILEYIIGWRHQREMGGEQGKSGMRYRFGTWNVLGMGSDKELWCELALWQNPIWRRSSRRGTGGTRPRLAIAESRHQVAESLSKLSLSGLRWEEASSKIYQTVRTVVETTRQKAKYWVHDHREEVDQIVLERKAAGNTAQA